MLTIYSSDHQLHRGVELKDGAITDSFENPLRAETVLAQVRASGLGDVVAPRAFDRACYAGAHSRRYVDFLAGAWDEWRATGRTCQALPLVWPVRAMPSGATPPAFIDGKLGFFAMDAGSPINAGTWAAASASANSALTGAELLSNGTRAAFALCRPPGHHAGREYMGGYCYLNNAAIAAQHAIARGAARVAVLDVDFHHGNGTQDIFYDRADVLFVSIHGEPPVSYPYFSGYADERGTGAGEGFNLNLPLPKGTAWSGYDAALGRAAAAIAAHAPDVLVVSLGVDTFEHDPISHFRLRSQDYLRIGEALARLSLPTLFVMEGGYMVDEIGINAVNVLLGFEGRA
ncbi:acetylpolyamine aminohydrolase [Burkholderia stagnalis]|uniref:Histone deacetylase family protein n=1 Tax=Burkholderia stagnalis TaxID=1503054 RepID=A0A6L3MZJ4_9BURK|nr:histone deacetylase family protein [Burkholderia stagnalis]KAB0638518.1 histone deacetylase family protein [Burkholderia stagnalis]KVO43754.1 acetylpolyamine aminohydrolase [Burkholderia stagnalis]KVO81782.1 acetylpolyamine aminohydrolase [Burkholderia stagnalis]KVW69825.1 acetylpolyamine aminohydrolase [Burkholderia stagnalis]KVW76682.1 acetylpolyamine aminohydrolase [Burkholderia stagnalis]